MKHEEMMKQLDNLCDGREVTLPKWSFYDSIAYVLYFSNFVDEVREKMFKRIEDGLYFGDIQQTLELAKESYNDALGLVMDKGEWF